MHNAETKSQVSFAVTAKLARTFVFDTRIVQFLYFINPNFPASSLLLCLLSLVCVGPGRKPHCWFSHNAAYISLRSSSILVVVIIHYENMPMQYTDNILVVKNENFHWKNFDIFLIFAQNIDCGYTLEPPRRGGFNEYPQSMFWSKNKKNRFTPAYPSFVK